MNFDQLPVTDRQVMMHGPLTVAQTKSAQRTDARDGHGWGERIVRIVEAMPPFTPEQLVKLAVLLRPEVSAVPLVPAVPADPRAVLTRRIRESEREARRLRKELAQMR